MAEQSTTITFIIDDGTGQVTAKWWLDVEDNSDAQAKKRGQITQVYIFGSYASYLLTPTVAATTIVV